MSQITPFMEASLPSPTPSSHACPCSALATCIPYLFRNLHTCFDDPFTHMPLQLGVAPNVWKHRACFIGHIQFQDTWKAPRDIQTHYSPQAEAPTMTTHSFILSFIHSAMTTCYVPTMSQIMGTEQ